MESEQHPSSSLLLSHQHDFSSLVSWPHHWQPESFEITTHQISLVPRPNFLAHPMTQVVPEHVARAKLSTDPNNNLRRESKTTKKNRAQRSNSATLSTISVTCDTDTSQRSRHHRHPSSPAKDAGLSNKKIATSQSSATLMNVHSNNAPPPTSFRHHQQYRTTGNSSPSISSSLTTTSGMNIIHEKSTLTSSTSTTLIPNKQLNKTAGGGGKGAGAVGGTGISTKSLSNKHKATSFDDHHSQHRASQSRGIGRSVLEHLVFVFPDNVRRMLTGPKNLPLGPQEGRQAAEPVDIGEPPSLDEIKSWSDSFDKLMLNPAGRRYFRDFLRSEYSEENFLFWTSCESLKNEQNPEIVEEKARLIYEDYISILSPKEVSLDSRVREVINKNMVEPSPHTFDEAQLQIYTLMHRDSYPRFLNSQIYRRLIRNEGTST